MEIKRSEHQFILLANMALEAEKLVEYVKKHAILCISTAKSYKDSKREEYQSAIFA